MNDIAMFAGALGLGGVLTTIITIIATKGKSSAETTDLITQAVARTVELLDKEISRLLSRIQQLETSDGDLRLALEEAKNEIATLKEVKRALEAEKESLIAKLTK